ncbi:MAG: hypothetical protein GDA68_22400, partial [Nitrospira sp. CR2.1]|nr:hypothetical protein [Nitrospira sp. CR2.1]
MIIQIKNPDPAWAVSLQTRAAVLWIGPDWKRFLGPEGAHTEHIQSLISHPWAAVFVDASDLAVADLRELTIESLELVIRLFDVDPTVEQLPPNRLPVYFVRGPNRTTTAGSQVDPKGMLNRLKMLARMPAGTDLFVIGISSAAELAGIAEARSIAQSLRRIIVVDTLINSLEAIDHDSQSIVHWLVGAPEFFGLLTEAENLSSEKSPTTILIRTPTGSRAIDIGKAIDPSYPLTQSFELITARDLLEEHEVSIEDVERFLGCPAASWAPYALGIPWPRHQPYVNTLLRELDAFQREGPAASFTAWITAEDGSGATTTLRQVCFSLAREGFPVLLAKPSVERYDYSQLNSFLVQAVGRIGDFDVDTAELPWIIAFDADHTQLHWEFVSALCNGLKKLLRSVVVLAIRSKSNRTLENRQRALGTNRELSPELQNSITPSDAEQLGRHFMSFLPPHLGRSRAEWVEFIESTIQ